MILGYKVFWVFFGMAIFCLIGPRLENSMDEVYCGQRIANHNLKTWNWVALGFLLIEITLDIIINVN